MGDFHFQLWGIMHCYNFPSLKCFIFIFQWRSDYFITFSLIIMIHLLIFHNHCFFSSTFWNCFWIISSIFLLSMKDYIEVNGLIKAIQIKLSFSVWFCILSIFLGQRLELCREDQEVSDKSLSRKAQSLVPRSLFHPLQLH